MFLWGQNCPPPFPAVLWGALGKAMPTCSTERRQQDHPAPSSNPWRPDCLVLSRHPCIPTKCRWKDFGDTAAGLLKSPKSLGLESSWPETIGERTGSKPQPPPFLKAGFQEPGQPGFQGPSSCRTLPGSATGRHPRPKQGSELLISTLLALWQGCGTLVTVTPAQEAVEIFDARG